MTTSHASIWRPSGVAGRVFLGTAAIVAVVISAAFVIAASSLRAAGEAAARRALEQSADLVAQSLAGRGRSLAGGARVFVQGPYFRSLVSQQRADDILDQSMEAAEQLDADWVFITDQRGVVLAKSDEPSAANASMANVPLVAGALRGLVSTGFGVSRDSLLFQAIAVPITTPGGGVIGTLIATRIVDSMLVRDVRSATSSELLFYVNDTLGARRIVISTLSGAPAPDLAQAVAAAPGTQRSENQVVPDVAISGMHYLMQGTALTTAGGDVVGGFVVLRSRDAELTGIASLRRSLAIAGLLGLLLSLGAAYAAAQRIARPVRTLSGVVRRAADGEYVADLDATVASMGNAGEMRELGDAFAALLADLRGKDRLAGLTPAATAQRNGDGSPGARAPLALRPNQELAPGDVLANRYRIDAVVGRGGLGIVYRAHDRVLGESVALKMLRTEGPATDVSVVAKLTDEVRLARRVSHRNVVRMHDIGSSDHRLFLTMEYVDGVSLATLIEARGALPLPAVISIAKQLLRALSVMHAEGLIHGDLKPANLLLGPSGVLKVTDFGIARIGRSAAEPAERDTDALPHLAGATVGTPEYMAPEQLIGAPAGVASDIYAAGVVLHECLRGVTPFGADTRVSFIAHKLDTAAPAAPVARPVLDAARATTAFEAIVARMMTPSVERRPSSASALYEEIAQLDD